MTFIDGIAGARRRPCRCRRRTTSGSTVTVRSGTPGSATSCTTTAGWDTVAVIADDYSFGWTSAAGFIADFCAVGGDVVHAGVPAARHDRLLVVHRSSCPTRTRSTATSGSSAAPAPRRRSRRSSTPRATSTATSTPATCSSTRRWRRRSGPDIAGAYVGGFASPRRRRHRRRRSRTTSASADAAWDTLAGGATGGEAGPPSTVAGVRLRLRLLRRRHGPHPGARTRSTATCPTTTRRSARRCRR